MGFQNSTGVVQMPQYIISEWLMNGPLLIYGPRKSGTTLLQNLLDGGEQLLIYPSELKLKYLKDITWPSDINAALKMFSEISTVEKVSGLNLNNYKNAILTPQVPTITGLRELIYNSIISIYNNIERRPKEIEFWAVKEVGGDTDEIIKLWRQMFLNGKILMIIRNPLMVTRSVLRNRRNKGIILSFMDIYKQVKDPFRVLSVQSKLFGDPTFCCISYEELTAQPKRVMSYICRHLNIQFADNFTTPTIFAEPVVVKTSSRIVKHVFNENCRWYSDLTKREIIYVLISLFQGSGSLSQDQIFDIPS
jgi:hypothetical protein